MTTFEPITIKVEYTQADLTEAHELFSRSAGSETGQSLWAKIWKHVLVLVVVALMGVYLRFHSSSHSAPRYYHPPAAPGSIILNAQSLTQILIVAVFISFCIFITIILLMARRTQRSGLQEMTFEMTFDESGHRVRTPTSATFHLWNHFQCARENERLFILIINSKEMVIVPKRAIPDAAAVDRLRGLIERHVGPGSWPSAPPPPPPVVSGDSTIP